MRGTESLRRRLRNLPKEMTEGGFWQHLPAILEYDESDPKGPWAGFKTRDEAVDWYWQVNRQQISFVSYAEDGSDDMWGTPLPGEPNHDKWFIG